MELNFNIDVIGLPLVRILLGIGLLATLYMVLVYRSRIIKVVRHHRGESRLENASSGREFMVPAMSVIVYCRDSARALERLLPEILNQNMPVPFEVIVTTDGRSERAEDVVKLLSVDHKNLRMTYVPDEAHALSRKKLAVTLGVKAARYDYVVLTDANAMVTSYDWLTLIGRHFAQGKEVVIGSDYPSEGDALRGLTRYNMLVDKVTYLSGALAGKAYRGSECNMAFRRDLFFDNKGFNESLGLQNGIDDIFLSRIVSKGNYGVELSGQSQVAANVEAMGDGYRDYRAKHRFTGKHLCKGARRLMGLGSLCAWLWLGATVASGVMFVPEMLPLCIMVAMGVVWMTMVGMAWKAASRALHVPVKGVMLPLYIFARPLTTFFMWQKGMRHRSSNYTWSKVTGVYGKA